MKNRYLVQILLPVRDNAGATFPPSLLHDIRQRLAAQFGGVTAFTRAPAEGIWAPDDAPASTDDIVIVEVMVEDLNEAWWRNFRQQLERDLRQAEIVVRAHQILTL